MRDDVHFYIALIKEVEQNICLYDHHHQDHNDRRLTEGIWTNIGCKFGETAFNCKNKWKTIRCNYTRSLNIKAKSGNSAVKDYYLSPFLQFLRPFIKIRAQDDFFNFFSTTAYSSEEYLGNYNDQQQRLIFPKIEPLETKYTPPTTSNPVKKENGKRDIFDVYECMIDNLNEKKKKLEEAEIKRDHLELYLLSLAPHVKTMTPREQLSFQIGVVKLIEKIKYSEPS